MRALIRFVIVALLLALGASAARAEEIRVLSSVGIKPVVEELAIQFERATKHRVTAVFDLAVAIKGKIDGGAPFDVAILTPPLMDDLISTRKVSSASRTEVARVGLGLMIKAGARKPDVSTVEAFKKSLLEARAVTYAPAGASGVAFLATVEKLGIADAIKAKAKPAANGDQVNANILTGAADLAVLPISEILPVKGAELGAAFPAAVQTYVVMVAGVNVNASNSVGKEFVAFLMSAPNSAVVRAKGMER
jgi:molybdate transport system substrate-binding protein